MKKLLFILLLACNVSLGQISISVLAYENCVTTNGTLFGPINATLTAGRLYLYVGITTGTTNNGVLTTTTTTWDNVFNVGDATRRIQVFRYMGTSTVTGETVQLGTFGGGGFSSGFHYKIYEITGVQTGSNGANAIVQTITQTATTSADPSLTLSSTSARNTVMAFFANDANPFGGTAESGWTEETDCGYDTPTSGVYTMYRATTTDNTPTVTSSSSTWLGGALELRQSGRITIID